MKSSAAVMVLVLLLAGCDRATDPQVGAVQNLGPPVATGLFLTDENNVARGIWGSPIEGGLRTYPNPSSGVNMVNFEISRSGHVRCWVVPALPPEEAGVLQATHAAGAMVLVNGAAPVAILMDQVLANGTYEVSWNMHQSDGRPAPSGFYRFYLQTESGLFFNDHYSQAGDDFWLPAGLEDWFH